MYLYYIKDDFKWSSMQRWQCLIHKGTLGTFILINNIEDIIVLLDLRVFYSKISPLVKKLQLKIFCFEGHF